MKIKGHIRSIKSSEDRMGDIVHLLTLEIAGDIEGLQSYVKKSLDIEIKQEVFP
jgi:hypothetical protein